MIPKKWTGSLPDFKDFTYQMVCLDFLVDFLESYGFSDDLEKTLYVNPALSLELNLEVPYSGLYCGNDTPKPVQEFWCTGKETELSDIFLHIWCWVISVPFDSSRRDLSNCAFLVFQFIKIKHYEIFSETPKKDSFCNTSFQNPYINCCMVLYQEMLWVFEVIEGKSISIVLRN